jgi:hypothetical protein
VAGQAVILRRRAAQPSSIAAQALSLVPLLRAIVTSAVASLLLRSLSALVVVTVALLVTITSVLGAFLRATST